MHLVFNTAAPYRYLLHTVYLFVADIANPDLIVYDCWTWINLDIARFYEEQCQPWHGSAPPPPKKEVNRPFIAGARCFETICTAVYHNHCDSYTTLKAVSIGTIPFLVCSSTCGQLAVVSLCGILGYDNSAWVLSVSTSLCHLLHPMSMTEEGELKIRNNLSISGELL